LFESRRLLNLFIDDLVNKSDLINSEMIEADEERGLFEKIKKGNRQALERVVAANQRNVINIAKVYLNLGLPLMDLIGEGNRGLFEAIDRFDEKRGVRFISYAHWWIKVFMEDALAKQAYVCQLPRSVTKVNSQIKKISNQLAEELGQEPELEKIAEKLEISLDRAKEAIQLCSKYFSLNKCIDDEEKKGDSFILNLIDKSILPADKITEKNQLSEIINETLKTLKDREKLVIINYFGLNNQPALTLKEIGCKIEVSEERVRQIKEKALQRLRHPTRSRELKVYCQD